MDTWLPSRTILQEMALAPIGEDLLNLPVVAYFDGYGVLSIASTSYVRGGIGLLGRYV